MSKNTTKYELHDEITWCGAKGDNATRHKGKIVHVVAAYNNFPISINSVMDSLSREYGAIAPKECGNSRAHESYIVLVTAKTPRHKSRLYYPHVSRLELASRPKERCDEE
jgi:hypothetical protein